MTNRIERNPLTGETSLIAPNRLDRPNALFGGERASSCPFCPGNEHETPPEIERVPGDGGWIVRVVPNKFPIASGKSGIDGVHEVIVESPEHDDELRSMSATHRRAIVDVWLRRIELARSVDGVGFVLLFRNRGLHAGESIRHPHSQLLGIPFVPPRIAQHDFGDATCPLCSHEPQIEVDAIGSFTIMAAPAARFMHQCWIVPVAHQPAPELNDTQRDDLARAIGETEALLVKEMGNVSMNWSLIQAPVGGDRFHWYIEVIPRVTGIAGFELATGVFVNLLPPEESAKRLRERKSWRKSLA